MIDINLKHLTERVRSLSWDFEVGERGGARG